MGALPRGPGVRIVKLCLNISKKEQRRQFLERIDDPQKNWKFSAADVRERQHWDGYQRAFSAMLSATSTEWAPWHVIPADHRWFARVAAAGVIVDALSRIDPRYPSLHEDGRRALQEARAQLESEVPGGGAGAAPPTGATAASAAPPAPEWAGASSDGPAPVPGRAHHRGGKKSKKRHKKHGGKHR